MLDGTHGGTLLGNIIHSYSLLTAPLGTSTGIAPDISMSINQNTIIINRLKTSSEYEIPEAIRELHQLTLQYINQVYGM